MTLVLTILPGVHGFISLDPDCIAIYTYLQFIGQKFSVNYEYKNISQVPKLTIIQQNGDNINSYKDNGKERPATDDSLSSNRRKEIYGYSGIINYLKHHHMDLDRGLIENDEDQIRLFTYSNLIRETLLDGLLYNWWLESENYLKSTKPALNKLLPFFSRYMVSSEILKKANERLAGMEFVRNFDEQSKVGKELVPKIPLVYLSVKKCYHALDVLLSSITSNTSAAVSHSNYISNSSSDSGNAQTEREKKLFFFGDPVSSLDILAYAYLSLHALPSLAEPKLFSMLTFGYPRLIALVDRINQMTKKMSRVSPVPVLQELTLKEKIYGYYSSLRTIGQKKDNNSHYHSSDMTQSDKNMNRRQTMIFSAGIVSIFVLYTEFTFRKLME